MKRIIMVLLLAAMFATTAKAQELTAPTVPPKAEKFMPETTNNFLNGILEVIWDALAAIRPDLRTACGVCLRIATVIMGLSLLRTFPGASQRTCNLAGTVGISLILLESTGSLVNLAATTVTEVSEYGKLLLPVMTAALSAQGSITSSASLYVLTAFFNAFLSGIIGKLLTPMIFLFLLTAAANSAIGEETLKKLRDSIKWIVTWTLKTILYIYTGFISITGVVSGTTDAAALKAAKLTISSVVPVVGGILSDASEAVLVSAGTIKNTAGIYGFFAIIAIWIGPFLQIGVHYLLSKATGVLCAVFGSKEHTDLIQDFSSAMGLLLAMTGAICLMLLISLVCYLRGVG